MEREVLQVGVAIRRYVRRFLLQNSIPFVEEKGWLNSEFYIEKKDVPLVAKYFSKINK